ncbi:MAG TPA: patatin family protein [Candidatus Lachnoclostridium pullistercoris]|uniref:Patatin family protein n=1 Tax=Candidatus Lachnoclostridium pullistercoris TaxID=2838632 RepID=A0A9D2PEM3_9FIRM|nr:patatin family protein [Candidatus Lachnoclostridium pullistercoris]
MRTGLVLEGGGMRGMYTAGVLDVMMDREIQADGIIGVSAGALFGVNYFSGQQGRALRYNLKYAGDRRYMGLSALMKTGNIVGREFAFYEVPMKLDVFDDEAYKRRGGDFYAVATNVRTGEAEYLKIDSVFEQMEALRATSAMPLVSKMIPYQGQYYLDGGIADSIPVEKCLEMGYDRVVAVLTRPLEYRKKPFSMPAEKAIRRKYKNFEKLTEQILNRYENYNRQAERTAELEREGRIFVLRPSETIHLSRVEKRKEKLLEMYHLGEEDCRREMKRLEEYLGK